MNKKVLSNVSWIIGCKIVKAFLTLIVTMITARYLGPQKYGIVNYAASLISFVSPIMMLGFDSTLVHEIVVHPNMEGKTIGTAIILNFLSGICCSCSVIIFVFCVNFGDVEKLIICSIYTLMLLFQSLEMIQYWFNAKLLSKYTASSMLVSYIIVSIIQILLLVLHASIYLYTFSLVLDYLIISILLIAKYYKLSNQKLKFDKKRAIEMIAESKSFILSSMMIVIFAKTDTIMISLMLGDSETGFYSAAVTCAGMTSFVFAAIINSMQPVIFEKIEKGDMEGFKRGVIKLYCIITYCSLLQCLIMTIFAPIVIGIIYGTSFSRSIAPLRIIVWYTTFSYYGSIRNIWILANNMQKYLWKINCMGAVANVIINFCLIPILGINGAAIASLITQFYTNVVVGYIYKDIRENNVLLFKGINPKELEEMLKKSVLFIKSNLKIEKK